MKNNKKKESAIKMIRVTPKIKKYIEKHRLYVEEKNYEILQRLLKVK